MATTVSTKTLTTAIGALTGGMISDDDGYGTILGAATGAVVGHNFTVIKPNKTDFSFQNPNKAKEQTKPTEAYKTQTAVNSEGKTNESTKNIKEPLKSGQKNPDSKEQQEQLETPEAPARSKGRKL